MLLDTYAHTFPTLRNLNLFYNLGLVHHDGEGKSRKLFINLENYKLQCSTIDLTRVKAYSPTDDFFDLKVQSLEKTEWYKISVDLPSITKINVDDGQSSMCVHILINSLQKLAGYMYFGDPAEEEYLDDLCSNILKYMSP